MALYAFDGTWNTRKDGEDAATLRRAREGSAALIDLMMQEARRQGWSTPSEFFLNYALAHRRHLFPFTD